MMRNHGVSDFGFAWEFQRNSEDCQLAVKGCIEEHLFDVNN